MDEKKYSRKEREKTIETDNPYSYQKFPRLISGLKESCLVRLIKPGDFLELRIVPARRE